MFYHCATASGHRSPRFVLSLKVEDEMVKLRAQLRVKMKRRTFLRRMLGVSKVEAFLRNNFQQVNINITR
jgi:hypothetical protein